MTNISTPAVSTIHKSALPDEGHVSAAIADVIAERTGHLFGLMRWALPLPISSAD